MHNNKMNILVFGGAGFIGNHLARKLIKLGFKVFIFDDFSNPSLLPLPKKTVVINKDITVLDDVNKAMREAQPSIVINLAAKHYVPWCEENKDHTMLVNVIGNRNILNSLNKIRRKPMYIFTSSAAVYKNHPITLKESSPCEPTTVYGKSKLLAEIDIKKYSQKYKINYIIIRLFNVYGIGDRSPHLIPRILTQASSNKIIELGNIITKRDYIHTSDIVSAIALIIKKKNIGTHILNLGCGISYSAKEIVELLNHLRPHAKYKIKSISKFKRKNDSADITADNSLARLKLSWNPVYGLEKGLREIIKSYSK